MTEQRKKELSEEVRNRWSRLQDQSAAEKRMLKIIGELLGEDEDKKSDGRTLESEYKRGYENGVNDEQERQYEAKMAAKKAKEKPPETKPPEPEEELPFGEVE